MFDEVALRRLPELHELYDISSIGSGITNSFIGTAPNGDRVMLKRRDQSWDCDRYNMWYNDGWSPSIDAEILWYDITQMLGGEWRRCPPVIGCWDEILVRDQFSDPDCDIPSTNVVYHAEEDGLDEYRFCGTMHLWVERTTHDHYQTDYNSGEVQDWSDYVRMRLLDVVLFNNDRHSYNYLFDKDLKAADGEPRVYMIDHGRSFFNRYEHDDWNGAAHVRQRMWPTPDKWTRRGKIVLYHAASDLLGHADAIANRIYSAGLQMETTLDERPDLIAEICTAVAEATAKEGSPVTYRTCSCPCCRQYKHNKEVNHGTS